MGLDYWKTLSSSVTFSRRRLREVVDVVEGRRRAGTSRKSSEWFLPGSCKDGSESRREHVI